MCSYIYSATVTVHTLPYHWLQQEYSLYQLFQMGTIKVRGGRQRAREAEDNSCFGYHVCVALRGVAD